MYLVDYSAYCSFCFVGLDYRPKDFILKYHIIYLFNIIIGSMEILNFIHSLYSLKLAFLCYPVLEVRVYFTSRIAQIFCNFIESFATSNIRLLRDQQTVNKIFHKAHMSRQSTCLPSLFSILCIRLLTWSSEIVLWRRFPCAQTWFGFGLYFTKKPQFQFPFFGAFSNFLHTQLAQLQA